jgi:hypothetical protein
MSIASMMPALYGEQKNSSGHAAMEKDDVRLHPSRPESRIPHQSTEFQRSRYATGEFEEKKVYNRIFVGGLNETINEDDLRTLFGRFGEIKEVQLKDRGAKKDETRRGHGFITYKNKEQAAVALREGRGEVLVIRGIKLNVCQAVRRVGKQIGGKGSDHSQHHGRSESLSPTPSHGSLMGSAGGMGSSMAGGFGQYPGMMPYALNPYTLQMLNAGFGMPGYGWPYYSQMYGCPSISPSMSSDPSCVNCCDMFSDHSGTDTVLSSPERIPIERADFFGSRPSAFAEMNGNGYIAMPEDRGFNIISNAKIFDRNNNNMGNHLLTDMDKLGRANVSRFTNSRTMGGEHTPRSNTRH